MGCHANVQMIPLWAGCIDANSFSSPTCQKKMPPSAPPETKRDSWVGCQEMQATSLGWPRNTCSSDLRLRMSNTFTMWSREAVSGKMVEKGVKLG